MVDQDLEKSFSLVAHCGCLLGVSNVDGRVMNNFAEGICVLGCSDTYELSILPESNVEC